MSKYVLPSRLPPELAGFVDPDGGFLCMTTHWRPNPNDADPDMPGQKMKMTSFIPAWPTEDCLCSSGKSYRACCQRRRVWHPICPNPDMQGYRLMVPQMATFNNVDGLALRERLMADVRLRCVDESETSSFWLFWGDPPVEDQYGILCFGDIELKRNRTLLVSAMSDLRMRLLLDVVQETAGDYLSEPQVRISDMPVIEKPPGKPGTGRSKGKPRRKRRK
jgi:hypothetical protein